MKITIVGAGKVGETLCQDLAQSGHDITLIDQNEKLLDQLMAQMDISGFEGNGALYDVQVESSVADSDIFIAVTPKDETNIIAALTAKSLGATKAIARVRDPNYTKQIAFLRSKLGIDMILNPELQAARDISTGLQFPAAVSVEQFAHGRVYLVNLVVPKDSAAIGMNMIALRTKFKNLIFCAVARKSGEVLIPSGLTTLEAQDELAVTGEVKELNAFYSFLGLHADKIKNALIIGGGKITNYLIPRLYRANITPKVIEVNLRTAEALARQYPKLQVICADGTNQSVLEEEHIGQYDAVVSLTGIDEENILISLYAESVAVPKVISKVNRLNLLSLLYKHEYTNNMEAHTIVTPRLLVADQIVRFIRAQGNATGSNVDALYRICEDRVEALQFKVKSGSKCIDIPLSALHTKKNILIAYILRDNKLIFPSGQDCIKVNDKVIVITTHKDFDDLDDILDDFAGGEA